MYVEHCYIRSYIWLHGYTVMHVHVQGGQRVLLSVPRRIWDVECGACLRLLEGHEELVR